LSGARSRRTAARAKLDALSLESASNGRGREAAEVGGDPGEGATGAVEIGGFSNLLIGEALAAEHDAVGLQQGRDGAFSEAVLGHELVRRVTGLILGDDLVDLCPIESPFQRTSGADASRLLRSKR